MTNQQHPEIPDFATLAADPEIAPLLHFTPVVRKVKRPDGWTAELQRELIARIAATGTLQQAVWQMGKHATGAEGLYKVASADSFRASWDAAIAIGRRRNGLDSQPPFTGDVPGIARRSASAERASTAAAPADPLAVICDNCRQAGLPGEGPFAALPDLIAFDPVPRPAHDNLWPAETQRAFIAALAVSGSAERAARSVNRHTFGAEKLRKARGSRSFAEAWDAALDLARERELTRLHGSLSDLAERAANPDDEREDDEAGDNGIEELRERVFAKLQRMRKRMLREEIIPDAEKRAAWVLLNGEDELHAVESGLSTEAKASGGAADPAT